MIHLQRPDEPPGFPEAMTEHINHIQAIVNSNRNPKDEDFYPAWGAYKYVFENAHDRKCAYCETRFGAAYPGDLDHHQPKTMVQNAMTRGDRDDTVSPRPKRKFGPAVRPGYYQLAYVFTNYVLVCKNCNTWKMSQFPLPLILNPYDDADPLAELEFDEMGQISARSGSPRGQKTIDVCGLDRRTLEIEREIRAHEVTQTVNDYALALRQGNIVWQNSCLRRLLEMCHEKTSYAGMARRLCEQYELPYELLRDAEANGLLD